MTDTHHPLIAIVYHSGSGPTAEMAHAVARGAAAVSGASVKEFALQDGDFNAGRWSNETLLSELDADDAIILGGGWTNSPPPSPSRARRRATK